MKVKWNMSAELQKPRYRTEDLNDALDRAINQLTALKEYTSAKNAKHILGMVSCNLSIMEKTVED